MKAMIDGRVRVLKEVVGEGGEAMVYAVDADRVAKIAKVRCDVAKLNALKAFSLPACVVAPQDFVHDQSGANVIGYLMPRVPDAEALCGYSLPDCRAKGFSAEDALTLLRQLHADLKAIHRAGIIVGDLNDSNVLLSRRTPRWIDADSYALPGFPCPVFSERYLDPRLMDAQGVLCKPYDQGSDWYAFCAIALELLLFVGPYSGVEPGHTLRDRVQRRSTIFAKTVRRPKAMPAFDTLAPELLFALENVLARDERSFDVTTLKLRPAAPASASAPVPAGRLRVRDVQIVPELAAFIAEVRGAQLLCKARKAHPLAEPLDVGQVIEGRTQVFLGEHFGLALMRMSFGMGAIFRPDRKGMNDALRFPAIRARIRDVSCTFSADHAWLFYEREEAGKRHRGCYLVSIRGEHVAHTEDAEWMTRFGGCAAVGATLFVPTDDGIARVDANNGALTLTRVFEETAPYVNTESKLSCRADGIAVVINEHTGSFGPPAVEPVRMPTRNDHRSGADPVLTSRLGSGTNQSSYSHRVLSLEEKP